jgi:hypothetical protein
VLTDNGLANRSNAYRAVLGPPLGSTATAWRWVAAGCRCNAGRNIGPPSASQVRIAPTLQRGCGTPRRGPSSGLSQTAEESREGTR